MVVVGYLTKTRNIGNGRSISFDPDDIGSRATGSGALDHRSGGVGEIHPVWWFLQEHRTRIVGQTSTSCTKIKRVNSHPINIHQRGGNNTERCPPMIIGRTFVTVHVGFVLDQKNDCSNNRHRFECWFCGDGDTLNDDGSSETRFYHFHWLLVSWYGPVGLGKIGQSNTRNGANEEMRQCGSDWSRPINWFSSGRWRKWRHVALFLPRSSFSVPLPRRFNIEPQRPIIFNAVASIILFRIDNLHVLIGSSHVTDENEFIADGNDWFNLGGGRPLWWHFPCTSLVLGAPTKANNIHLFHMLF